MARTPYLCNKQLYENHFLQTGSGDYFQGLPIQRGYGLGSIIKSLLIGKVPYIQKYAKHITKPLLKAGKDAFAEVGKDVISDIVQGKNIKNILKTRSREAVKGVVRNVMTGKGVKRLRDKPKQVKQMRENKRKIIRATKRRKIEKQDIFS